MRPSLRTLSALPTAGNSGVGTNYAHKSSKRLTRFRKDLRTIEENGTWDALKILVTFPEREISVALRTVCGSNVASGKCRENDMDSRLDAVAHILEGCLEEYTREEKEEILVGGAIASASKGRYEILQRLIEYDDNDDDVDIVNGQDQHGFSSLLGACCGDYEEGERVEMEMNRHKCIEILLEHGADVENRGAGVHKKNWTALMALAKRNDLESLRLVFKMTDENTLDVNRTYSNGKTALFVACEWGASIDVINLLLEKGAKNIPATKLNTDYSRFVPSTTPIDIAMENGHHEVVFALNEYNDKNSLAWFSTGNDEREKKKGEEEAIFNSKETKMNFDERVEPGIIQGGESW